MRPLFVLGLVVVSGAVWAQEDVHYLVPEPQVFTRSDGAVYTGTMVFSTSALPLDPVGLLQTPHVLGELELVDAQREKLAARIAELTQDLQRKEQQFFKTMAAAPEKSAEAINAARNKFANDIKAASEEILLPFQLERLKQIRLQAELRARGSRALDSEAFAELLELTPEQKSELQQKARAVEEKLAEEIQSLRKKRHREVLEDVLTKQQLQTLDDSLGKPVADTK